MESSGQASSWVMGSSAANDNFNHLVTTRTWSQVLLLLSFLFLGKKNPRHTQNMFGLLLGTLDYLQMAGSKDPINLQQPQLHLISRIIGLNKEIKWKPRKTTEKNWKCSHLVKVEPDEIKHEYLRSRAYICLSLSSPLVMVAQLWPLSRYSCFYLGSLHPRNFVKNLAKLKAW